LFKVPSSFANAYLLSSPDNWRNTYLRAINKEHRQQTLPFTNRRSICSILPVTSYGLRYGYPRSRLPLSCPSSLPAAQDCRSFLPRDQLRGGATGASAQLALRATAGGEQVTELSGTPSL